LEPGKPDNIEIIKYGKVWKDVRQLPATQNIPNQPATPCPGFTEQTLHGKADLCLEALAPFSPQRQQLSTGLEIEHGKPTDV
jgi:hypothetical protein